MSKKPRRGDIRHQNYSDLHAEKKWNQGSGHKSPRSRMKSGSSFKDYTIVFSPVTGHQASDTNLSRIVESPHEADVSDFQTNPNPILLK